jgi:predicted Zn-dependent protease
LVVLRMRDTTPPDPATEAGQVVQHVGRGACLCGAKQYDAAKAEFENVITHAPHFPLVHYAYGRVLIDARDRAGAIAQFKAEIAEQPESALPRLRIAAAEYKVDSAAGLPYAEQAVKLAPQMPFAHFLLGLLLQSTGANERAVTELEIASKGLTQDKRVFWALGVAYNQVGRAKDAALARAEFARLNQKAKQQADNGVEIPDVVEKK